MDLLSNLAVGFSAALTLTNLFYAFVGCVLGTLVGILPGLGPAATIAMLLPVTFTLDPGTALIMLASIYYGAQYGGSTTAILVNLPGEASSVVTALDGYQLARQGKAGLALSTAALGSFVAGSGATLVIAAFAPLLTVAALQFHAADYFSLMVLGLIASVVLAQGSLLKALSMIVLGVLIGTVGLDLNSGAARFTFGSASLFDGISVVAVAMGIFGLGEVLQNLTVDKANRTAYDALVTAVMPSLSDVKRIAAPIARGTVLGSVLGILPGGGALLSSFASYALEKRVSKHPEMFGKGAIEGVAGPESANNAGAQTSFIPMLTLGIPSNVIMAMMAGAMILHGIQPGPNVIVERPELFWGLIASMWIGNLMLLVLNLPLIGIWVKMLQVPYKFMFPAILTFCVIGVFTLSLNNFDIYVMAVFGLFGFAFRQLDCEPAPFLMGLVLGPMLEEYLRRALLFAHGDPMVFIQRPISATLLALCFLAVLLVVVPGIRKTRDLALEQ